MPVLCPVCSIAVPDNETACPQCRTGLSDYLSVYYAPDMLFNKAQKLIEDKDYRSAYDLLAAAHFLRPHDIELITEMARCAELANDYAGAMEKLALAMAVTDSDDPALMREYTRINALLEERRKKENERVDPEKIYADIREIVDKTTRESVASLFSALGQFVVAGNRTAHTPEAAGRVTEAKRQ